MNWIFLDSFVILSGVWSVLLLPACI